MQVNKYPFPTVTFCSVNKVSTRALARWMTSSQQFVELYIENLRCNLKIQYEAFKRKLSCYRSASVLKVDDIRKILKILSTGRVDLETDLARLSQLMAKANITKGKRDYATLVKEVRRMYSIAPDDIYHTSCNTSTIPALLSFNKKY